MEVINPILQKWGGTKALNSVNFISLFFTGKKTPPKNLKPEYNIQNKTHSDHREKIVAYYILMSPKSHKNDM